MELYKGDCLEVMRGMEPNSVDAIVTDPPYGLEFMGKEWDKFDGTQQARWQGRKNTSIRIGEIANKNMRLMSYGKDTRGRRCSVCGHYKFSGTPCQCENPTWEVRTGTPPNMAAYQNFSKTWATAALRVAKPGCHLLAFGGTRTFHRLACAIEDAGWEIRDCLMWVYGSGFPKSHNLKGEWQGWGTALKPAWEPIILARKPLDGTVAENVQKWGTGSINIDGCRITANRLTGQRPCVILQTWEEEKNLCDSSVWPAENVVRHLAQAKRGCSALRIVGRIMSEKGKINHDDISRLVTGCYAGHCLGGQRESLIERGNLNTEESGNGNMVQSHQDIVSIIETATKAITDWRTLNFGPSENISDSIKENTITGSKNLRPEPSNRGSAAPVGRWPSNFIHDGSEEVVGLFPNVKTGNVKPYINSGSVSFKLSTQNRTGIFIGDSGSAARFFYCAKASRVEREMGLEGMESKAGNPNLISSKIIIRGHPENGKPTPSENKPSLPVRNHHPTVKPLALMRYLCRLIIPPNGLILDLFMGSGTTGMAAKQEGFRFVGIELDGEYHKIAEKRIAYAKQAYQSQLGI